MRKLEIPFFIIFQILLLLQQTFFSSFFWFRSFHVEHRKSKKQEERRCIVECKSTEIESKVRAEVKRRSDPASTQSSVYFSRGERDMRSSGIENRPQLDRLNEIWKKKEEEKAYIKIPDLLINYTLLKCVTEEMVDWKRLTSNLMRMCINIIFSSSPRYR